MGKTHASVYIATSLDGFIARPGGELDWLGGGSFDGPGEDYGYRQFMDSVDAVVMGRRTFEKVLTFGAWPYEGKRVGVLSSKPDAVPPSHADRATPMGGKPAAILDALADQGCKHAYVDGGDTVQRFLAAGLVRTLIVTRIPILIGAGIPLFGALPADVRLQHLETRQFPSGLVQSRYAIPAPAGRLS
jgi:dihydrofolate reductase